jgi:hypothetical protein
MISLQQDRARLVCRALLVFFVSYQFVPAGGLLLLTRFAADDLWMGPWYRQPCVELVVSQ